MTLETRRSFNAKLLGSLAAYGLIETLFARDLFADAVKPTIHKWMVDVHSLSQDVKTQKIKDIDYRTRTLENIVHGHLSLPQDWPTGKYKVQVFVNGDLDRTINYTIQ